MWVLAFVKAMKPEKKPQLDPLVKERLARYGMALATKKS
jgi:hypothetical protein